MADTSQKTTQFSGEEFIKVGEIARPFWEKGVSENPPHFVILMGGVGAGKTTMRRQKFSNDYVNFDFGEYYNAFKKEFGENDPKITSYTALACDLILRNTIDEKRNVVVEIIGNNKDMITPVIDGMVKIGYKVNISFVEVDPAEAYKRHLKAAKEDQDYMSAFYSQEPTLSSFYYLLGLGEMPITSQE